MKTRIAYCVLRIEHGSVTVGIVFVAFKEDVAGVVLRVVGDVGGLVGGVVRNCKNLHFFDFVLRRVRVVLLDVERQRGRR
ncbi:MAG: hypothetical protein ACYSR6_06320 [Planctomycetota bacterium]